MITSGNNDTSKSTSWKVLETIMSHLKQFIKIFTQVHIGYALQVVNFNDWCQVIFAAGVTQQPFLKNIARKVSSDI